MCPTRLYSDGPNYPCSMTEPLSIHVACVNYDHSTTIKMPSVYCTCMYNSIQNSISLVYSTQPLYTLSYVYNSNLIPSININFSFQ